MLDLYFSVMFANSILSLDHFAITLAQLKAWEKKISKSFQTFQQ